MNHLATWIAALAALLAAGCKQGLSNEHVGDMCTPDFIPSSASGRGVTPDESLVEESASQCAAGGVCVVHRLDNHTDGGVPADPAVLCDAKDPQPGCVDASDLERSVHCSCPCEGPGSREHLCECPDGYVCRELGSERLGTVFGSFCVKPM